MLSIREAAQRDIEAIRGGGGPRFLECVTYRWMQHVGPSEDFDAGYRTRDEAGRWYAGDWTKTIGDRLDADARREIDAAIEAEIRDAIAFADASPFPDPAELWTDVPAGT